MQAEKKPCEHREKADICKSRWEASEKKQLSQHLDLKLPTSLQWTECLGSCIISMSKPSPNEMVFGGGDDVER